MTAQTILAATLTATNAGPNWLESILGTATGALQAAGSGWLVSATTYDIGGRRDSDRCASDEAGGCIVLGTPIALDAELRRDCLRDGTAKALLTHYRERGRDAISSLAGHFALIIAAQDQSKLLAVVDRFASYSLAFAPVNGGFVIASSPAQVASHPMVDGAISQQGIFDYLYFTAIPAPRTIFQSVSMLEAGCMLEYTDGQAKQVSYWRPSFSSNARAGAALEGATGLKARMADAVAAQIEGADAAGCFLSGGLDSSTVAGTLREVTDAAPRTFSIGFEAEGYDELEYARLVATHFGAEHHEYYVTPKDVVELAPMIAGVYGQPFGNASVIPTYHCSMLAKEHGVDRLLAGDGGDELFGGNDRYARQLLFQHYWRLPDAVRKNIVEPLFADGLDFSAIPIVSKAQSFVRQARLPLPGRLQTYNYLERIAHDELFEAEFLQSIDVGSPDATMGRVYDGIGSSDALSSMLGFDFKFTLADNDLPKVTGMCALAGMGVRYPFLDHRVVDFSLGLASSDKVRGQQLRHFFKQAMTGFLPDEVIAKTKHGFGLPFGVWSRRDAQLRDFTDELLVGLKTRGIVRAAFIDQLQHQYLDEHPIYYGPLVWMLLMLELWFRHHGASARS